MIDLDKMEKKLDNALEKETKESLQNFLNKIKREEKTYLMMQKDYKAKELGDRK